MSLDRFSMGVGVGGIHQVSVLLWSFQLDLDKGMGKQ